MISSETPEETEARLQQLRVNQQQRLASETLEETEDRLEQLRVNQRQRMASETQEDTEARRQQDVRGPSDTCSFISSSTLR